MYIINRKKQKALSITQIGNLRRDNMSANTFNDDAMNFDMFSGVTEIKTARRGRPEIDHLNLDFAETRHFEFNQNDFKVLFSRRATNITERSLEILDADATEEDKEERNAFHSMVLITKYWWPEKSK